MRLRVGTSGLRGGIDRYAARYDLLELRAEVGALPRRPRLREWVERASDQLVFSVVLATAVAKLDDGSESAAGLDYGLKAAAALNAAWIVVRTPPSVTPTSRARRRLAELVSRLPSEQHRIVWEPAGLWEEDAALEVASELGVQLGADLGQGSVPPGPVVYGRLPKIASAGRAAAAERVGREIVGRQEAYIVIEGDGLDRLARIIRAEAASPIEEALR